MIKRREFCGSTLAALATATPLNRLLAAAAAPITGELAAVTGAGKQILLAKSDLEDLRAGLRGALLLSGDDGYDQARRAWNGAFDRHPALIARCAGAADVRMAVNFARAHELLVAVRGGGHSFSGQSVCDHGLMIDLSPMKGIRVDPLAKTASVAPGVLLGEFDREAQAFGLATTAGTVSHTGVSGLTLGGGFGRLCRKFGLAADNLQAVDIVTADGSFRRASSHENSDLFWGVRGGGGNFGVVTSLEFRLHPVGPTLLGGGLLYSWEHARDVLPFLAAFAKDAPDDINTDLFLTKLPDGQRVVGVDICYCGDFPAGERVIAPLRAFRKPIIDTVRPTPYVELQRQDDETLRHGRGYYIKSGFLDRLDAPLMDEAIARFESSPLSELDFIFVHHGGAVARLPNDATAFSHRAARHTIIIEARWDNPAEAEKNMEWARGIWPSFEPYTDGFYVNELSYDESERRIRATYGSSYDRLVALKNRYDPTNLFRLNANVKPRGSPT